MFAFGIFANATVYFAFFTGIYNFRSTELVNMRKVPFLAKFAASFLVAFTMCGKLWNKQVYEPDVYRLALKYRPQFDEAYKQKVSELL